MAENEWWNSRSLGSRLKHGFFYTVIRWLGLKPAYAFLYLVVFYYSLWPSVRRRSRPYLERRFPGASAFAMWGHAFRLNHTFGLVLLERAAMGITGRVTAGPDTNEERVVADLLGEGKGLLILTAHLGAWQMSMVGLEHCDVPVNIVQRRDAGDVDRHYFEHGGGGAVPEIIDVADPIAGLSLTAGALLRREIVCMMGDRVRTDSVALETEFLGGTILVPGTPYYLAGRFGCPVIVIFPRRSEAMTVSGKAYAIMRVPENCRRDPEKLQPYARRFTMAMEEFVADYPYQFFNFYDLWRK